MAPWPSHLTWFPAAAGSPNGSVGASILYSLALRPGAVSAVMLPVQGPALSPSATVHRCGLGAGAGPGPHVVPLSQPLAPRVSVSWVLGGFCPLPIPVLPPLSLCIPRWAPQRSCPPGRTLPIQGRRFPAATQPPLPLPGGPPWGFATLEALQPPSLPPTLEDSLAGFSRRPASLSLTPGLAPWRHPAPAPSTAVEVTSQLLPLLAAVTLCSATSPLPCDPPAVAIHVFIIPPHPSHGLRLPLCR